MARKEKKPKEVCEAKSRTLDDASVSRGRRHHDQDCRQSHGDSFGICQDDLGLRQKEQSAEAWKWKNLDPESGVCRIHGRGRRRNQRVHGVQAHREPPEDQEHYWQ